jgi:hypothetical protein
MEANKIDFAAMPQTAVRVVTAPAEFFQEMPKTGGFVEPLVFAAFLGALAGVIYAVSGILGLGHMAAGAGSSLLMIVYMPIGAVIGSFIGAAILFVIWKLMGSNENYETAYRCGAYLAALWPVVAMLSLIPYAGGIINMAIYLYFIVIVSVNVHNLPSQKAWLVFGIICLIFALLGLRSEYAARNMSSAAEQWQKAAKESAEAFKQSAKEMEKSTGDMQKQTEEMARQFQQQAEEAAKQAQQNK